MAVTYSQVEPASFRAGTTVIWQKSDVANYSREAGYTTAKYTVNGQNGSAEIEGEWDATTARWTFTLTAVQSAALPAGSYTLFGYVENESGGKQAIHESTIEILQDLTTASQVDTRSHAKKVLDAAKAVLEKRATKIQENQQLPNGVTIGILPPEDLVKLINEYEYKVAQELETERVRNGGRRRMILPSFNSTSY